MFIPVILGTARQGRESEKAARHIIEEAKGLGITAELLDVRDFRLSATDNTGSSKEARKLSSAVSKADAIIIVSPEYNHGYPGELKMMLDLLYGEYAGKPCAIVGVSSGPFGGVRMVEQLRLVTIELHMIPYPEALHFPKAGESFGPDGKMKDEGQKRRAKRFLESFAGYVKEKGIK